MLKEDTPVTLAIMAGAIRDSVQFVHVYPDIEELLTYLYDVEGRRYSSNAIMGQAVSRHLAFAYDSGALPEMVFMPLGTIKYLVSEQGSTCILCHNVEERASYCDVAYGATYPENTLMVYDHLGEHKSPAPTPYCGSCTRMLHWGITKKFKHLPASERIVASLSRVMEQKPFKENCKRGRQWRKQHRFDLPSRDLIGLSSLSSDVKHREQ